MMKNVVVTCFFLLFFSHTVGVSFADDADVLPKGVFNIGAENKFYFTVDERYGPDGDIEDVAVDYNTPLNSSVFSDLGLVESFFGMPSGSANIGSSVVSFDYEFIDSIFNFLYGVTDRLTVGVVIPYYWQKNNVKSRLDTSTATVGKSAIGAGFGAPLVPLALNPFGDAVPLTKEDVQDLLGRSLDVNGDGTPDVVTNLGYKRFETWSDDGVGDIEAGFRYQYLKTENWRLAFTGGVRFPTGEVEDIDNLTDIEFGTGAYALLFRLNNDFSGIRNLLLNATLRYDLYLPDKEEKRVPDNVNRPITANKEEVERNLGDRFEFEVSGKYELSKGLTISLLYNYFFKLKDGISGNKGFAYESLEDETDATSHIYIIGLSYSTVPLFMEKKFPVPLIASVAYRDRFAGSNNALNTKYILFGLQVYF